MTSVTDEINAASGMRSYMGEMRVAPVGDYPYMVIFSDINDPKTIMRVDPYRVSDTLGAGYKIKSVTFEITNQAITTGKLAKILPWIDALDGAMLDGRRTSIITAPNRVANDLQRMDFIRD